MKRLRKLSNEIQFDNPYNYKEDLNWRDDGNDSPDGQRIEDPSINDFIKGYNIDPYEFKQWAKKEKGFNKKAWREIDVLEFTPAYLADKILKLWNSADGLLQNMYEAFTLRYDNNLKKAIASELQQRGYTVYPLLIEDKPIYANHLKLVRKIMASKSNSSKDLQAYIKVCTRMKNINPAFKKSIAIKKLMAEVAEYENSEHKDMKKIDFEVLTDYYSLIYPKDYAIGLVRGLVKKDDANVKKKLFNHYEDFCMSDESLSAIEKYLSGNQDPISHNDGGVNGYDFVSDNRYDTTAPGLYEMQVTSKKKQ